MFFLMSAFDFVIEEFKTEYKNDTKEITKIINEYNVTKNEDILNNIKTFYPEFDKSEINNIPNTTFKSTFYLQSHKDTITMMPDDNKSLTVIILQDLSNKRDLNKKKASNAYKRGDINNFKRYNALQLGFKVISNSHYGVAGNKTFPFYDPDVAGTITWASRQCIGLLREALEFTTLYVDDEFMNEPNVKKNYLILHTLGFVNAEEIKNKNLKLPRRQTLSRMFDEFYEIKRDIKIYKITKVPCSVVYQDTDSNYFECLDIQKHYLGINPRNTDEPFICSPKTISEAMTTMLALCKFLGRLIELIIGRPPVGLGFEGSFIVCRYLNRKKKYYGVKAATDDGVPFEYLLNDKAYDAHGLPNIYYDTFWKPKMLTPKTNGDYIDMKYDVLLNKETNFLDYIQKYNIKTTGIDIARRDQYGYILYYHMNVLNNDLRLCKYSHEDKEWQGIPLTSKIGDVINHILREFRDCLNMFTNIASLKSDVKPVPNFSLEHFSKHQRYQPESKNDVYYIIERYKRDNLTQYIPNIGERLRYVIISNDECEKQILKGIKATHNLKDLRVGIVELYDTLHTKYTMNEFKQKVGQLNITYDEYINALAICKLYHKHYLSALISAMTLYLLGERFPNETARLDKNEISDPTTFIGKLQTKLTSEILETFYPSTKIKKINMKIPELKRTELKNKDVLISELMYKQFPNIIYDTSKHFDYYTKIKELCKKCDNKLTASISVMERMEHDKFLNIRFVTKEEQMIYENCVKNKNDIKDYISDIEEQRQRLHKLKKLFEREFEYTT